jgi:hypothetical protein
MHVTKRGLIVADIPPHAGLLHVPSYRQLRKGEAGQPEDVQCRLGLAIGRSRMASQSPAFDSGQSPRVRSGQW